MGHDTAQRLPDMQANHSHGGAAVELSAEEKATQREERAEQARQFAIATAQLFASGTVPAGVLQGVCLVVDSLLSQEKQP